jgi:hypothetical protein
MKRKAASSSPIIALTIFCRSMRAWPMSSTGTRPGTRPGMVAPEMPPADDFERPLVQRVSDAGPLASYQPVPRAGVGKPARKEPAGSRWDLADYGDLTSERV